MNKVYNIDTVLGMVKGLSKMEQSQLAEQIMAMLSKPAAERKDFCQEIKGISTSEVPDCPHCAAKAELGYVIKRGFKRGSQRYYCKSCGKYFVGTTNTVFAWSRKSAETWRKFIQLTIAGKSLHKCCEECAIAYQTAFTWRHKVLNAFLENQKNIKMSGVVEVDEMLMPISYKGNHVQGSFGVRKLEEGVINDMPRKSYCRGTDNKSMSSKEKACVFCMVENGNKSFYAAVPGMGYMNSDMLDHTVGEHINKSSAVMLADGYKITKKYFEDNGYQHKILSSNVSNNRNGHIPEICGNLHLQHVNSMHRHLRLFLAQYCGVSSKYLENYIALYVWIKSVKSINKSRSVEQISIVRATTPDCYISRKAIENRSAIPLCA